MSEGHAYCAPSDWEGWSRCPGKPALEELEPDSTSPDAEWGSRAHEITAQVLRDWLPRRKDTLQAMLTSLECPKDMAEPITLCLEHLAARVDAYRAQGAQVTLLVEQRLDISTVTGEKGARGTADVVLIVRFKDKPSILEVWDWKFGAGVVVEVIDNGQLQIYALAALATHALMDEFSEINLVILQPRVKTTPSEWRITPTQLYEFGAKVTEAAALSLSLRGQTEAVSFLEPGDKQCRFCRAKYRCPALTKQVHQEVFGDLQAEDDPAAVPIPVEDRVFMLDPKARAALLGRAMSRVKRIEDWCLATRAAVERELLAGKPVDGWKLVEGRKGARQWKDPETIKALVETDLDAEVAKQCFSTPQLLSPAQLEVLLQREKPELWETVQTLVSQSEGKPSVAPATDKRPSWTGKPSAEEFESYDVSHLI